MLDINSKKRKKFIQNTFQGPKGDRGMNPFSPFPRKGLPGDTGPPGLPGTIIRKN